MKRLKHFAALSLIIACPASAQVISGPATAIDGRTLDMTGTPIRLADIDAPELGQTCVLDAAIWACGSDARASLAQIIAGQTVSCTIRGRDQDEIRRALCKTRKLDIGREMVRRGMAVGLEYSPSDYIEAAQIAERMQFGLRASEFQLPEDWRAANPDAVLTFKTVPPRLQQPAPARAGLTQERRYTDGLGCAIKGNHSRYGDWIYHLPGQRYYEQTRPEELFCTESDARAAGYRRSKE